MGVGKVMNRLILPCTPLTTVPCTIFRYFVSITKPVLRRFLINRNLVWKGLRRMRDEPRTTKTTVTPPKGFKTVRKCLTLGTIPNVRFLEKA